MAVTVAAAVLLAAVFAGDSVWTAVLALLVAGAWGALALTGRLPLPDGGVVLGGLVLATAAWSGLSIAWSVAPELSWAELNRTLVYAAFLALGLLLGALRQGAKLAAAALVVALGAGVVWALAGKAIPAVFPDGGRAARLRDPIGYWNALALAADMLLVLALSFAASARTVAVRAGCAALAYAAVVAVLLAASRAGVAAAVLGIVLWLWLRRDRVEAALFVLVATVPAAAVAGWAFTRPALVEDGASRADRVADGAWFGLILLAGAVLVGLGALRGRPPSARAGRPEARGAPAPWPRARRRARDARGARPQRWPDRGRVPRRGGRERPGPVREPELEQPARLVGRGPERVRGGSARRRRREQLRGRPQALPRDRLVGDPAAQRPAPVPRRHRARRRGVIARARRRGGCCGGRRGEPPRGHGARCGGRTRRRVGALARACARRLPLGLRPGHRPGLLRRGSTGSRRQARAAGPLAVRRRGRCHRCPCCLRLGRQPVPRAAERPGGQLGARARRPRRCA